MLARNLLGRWLTATSVCVCGIASAQFEEMAGAATAADNQLFTGTQLYLRRNDTTFLTAYVAGVIDADDHPAQGHGHAFCLPPHGSPRRYIEIFVGYLAANPNRRQEPASTLVRESLVAAFRCGGAPN